MVEAANDNQPARIGPWLPTRAMAEVAGSKQYFTGVPCKRGHLSPRSVSSNNCIACAYDAGTRRRKSVSTAQSVRDYMREYQGRRRAEDPAFLARRREVGRRSDARPERRQKQNEQRKFRVTNDNDYRERINARDKDSKKAWKLANPEVVASHRRTRRARLAGAAGNHTAEDIDIIHARQRYRCAECGTSTEDVKHVDHIMPLALGGSNWPDNLQILCPLCNDRKGAKHPLDWAKAKGRLV